MAAGSGIEREKVIAAALEVLDAVGVEGLTMRRLAEALKIQAPSLYWHFPNKQALLDAMADALIASVALPRPQAAGRWQDRLGAIAGAVREALRARRDGARVFAGTYVVSAGVLRVAEAMMATLNEAGATADMAADGAFSLFYYVLGFTTEEQALEPHDGEGVDLASRRAQFVRLAADGYPNVLAAAGRIFGGSLDDRFSAGVDLLIGGIAVRIAAADET